MAKLSTTTCSKSDILPNFSFHSQFSGWKKLVKLFSILHFRCALPQAFWYAWNFENRSITAKNFQVLTARTTSARKSCPKLGKSPPASVIYVYGKWGPVSELYRYARYARFALIIKLSSPCLQPPSLPPSLLPPNLWALITLITSF